MRQIRRFIVVATLGALGTLGSLGGCILGDVIPKASETRYYERQLTITGPDPGSVLAPASSVYLQISSRDWPQGGSTLRITMNDSLWIEKRFDYSPQFSERFSPIDWAERGTTLTIAATCEGLGGITATDTVRVRVGDDFDWQPQLTYPADGHVFLATDYSTVRLEADSYVGGNGENYTFMVDPDPGFPAPALWSSSSPYVTTSGLTSGRYYWRVVVTSSSGLQSPPSETRTFSALEGWATSPEFQSFTVIDKLVQGDDGFFLLGDLGDRDGVMKCNEQFEVEWIHSLTDLEYPMLISDGDPLPGGGLLVAGRTSSYSGDSYLYGLDAAGAVTWQEAVDERTTIAAVRATADGSFFCGFSNQPHLTLVDSTATEEWNLTNNIRCYQLRTDDDRDHCVMLARAGSGGYILREIDRDGSVNWNRNLNVAVDYFRDPFVLTALAGGGHAFGSTVEANSTSSGYVVYTDPGGIIRWQRQIGEDITAGGRWILGDIREHPDGDVYVLGTVRSSAYNSNWDIMLTRFTADGALIWSRSYGSSGDSEYGTGLAVLDNRLALVGYQDASASDVSLVFFVDHDGAPLFR